MKCAAGQVALAGRRPLVLVDAHLRDGSVIQRANLEGLWWDHRGTPCDIVALSNPRLWTARTIDDPER